LLATVVQPLTYLSLFRAQQVWFMVNSALLGVLLYLSLTSIASEWIQQHWGLVVLAVVLAPPTYLCLQIGQLGIVMAVLLVAIYAMQARRSVGGLVLAVACVLKLFPALLGFYFFRRRAWLLLWHSGLATLSLLILNLAFVDYHAYVRYVSHLFPKNAFPAESEFNISLYGFWFRLFTNNGFTIPVVHFPLLAMLGTVVASSLTIILGLWGTPHGRDPHPAHTFSLWLTVLLLVSPINGYYNLSLVLFPMLTLIRHLRNHPSHSQTMGLMLATVLLWIPPGWTAPLGAVHRTLHTGWGLLFLTPSLYGLVIYFIILLVQLRGLQPTYVVYDG